MHGYVHPSFSLLYILTKDADGAIKSMHARTDSPCHPITVHMTEESPQSMTNTQYKEEFVNMPMTVGLTFIPPSLPPISQCKFIRQKQARRDALYHELMP